MDQNQLLQPLVGKKKAPLFVCSTKLLIKILILLLFVSWVAFIFLFATEFGHELFEKWVALTKGTPLGITGSLLLAFSGPILLIAFLAILHLIITGQDELPDQLNKGSKKPRFRLWTFPILVDGPFGVVSAAEFIGILLFVVYIIWAVYNYTLRNLNEMSDGQIIGETKSIWLLKMTGLRFGAIGLFCMAFLFLPIARGSVLLRFIDIPFEHATKYHVWLGHLTMIIFTLHGLFYVIGWTMEGDLLHQLLEWKDIGVANLAGVISLLAGILMWVTSLPPVRKWNFELFFYTHQLYVVFVVFLALHVGDFIFSMAAGPIFLFMLDRFLRFFQSRKTVNIISAKSFPCGTMELVFSKPKNLRYNALSFVFLQIRELSWLQWHPFSVSSSPSDGKYHLAILIKVLGKWTAQLRDSIRNVNPAEQVLSSQSHTLTKITASVEGPYGHECPYHLMYENLVLVAGGIGISPFLAVLSDVLHRIDDGRPCLPRNILIVWAVKKSDELPLLSTIDMESICPNFRSKVNLEIHVYVTRESEPPLEEGKIHMVENSLVCPMSKKGSGMSGLVGTGDNMWSGLYVISSTVGFVILVSLLYVFYINPYDITTWWYKGILFMACMAASIFIFGGFVIVLWHLWERKTLSLEDCEEDRIKVDHLPQNSHVPKKDMDLKDNVDSTIVRYGARPDFKEVFEAVSKRWGHVDVGVIVCGPPTLQTSVATEIRSHNLRRDFDNPIFHFNSHSFDL